MKKIIIGILFSITLNSYAGWYSACPSCQSHLGGLGAAGPFSSQSECESWRSRQSGFPYQSCYSSGSSGSKSTYDAEAIRRMIEARRQLRLQEEAELNRSAKRAMKFAENEKEKLKLLFANVANTSNSTKSFSNSTVTAQVARIGQYEELLEGVPEEHFVNSSVNSAQTDLFTKCMRGWAKDSMLKGDFPGIKKCLSLPLAKPSKIEIDFEDWKKKIKKFENIPGVGKISSWKTPWIFAYKAISLWELGMLVKISDEILKIEGVPSKAQYKKIYYSEFITPMAKEILSKGISKAASPLNDYIISGIHPLSGASWEKSMTKTVLTKKTKEIFSDEITPNTLLKWEKTLENSSHFFRTRGSKKWKN